VKKTEKLVADLGRNGDINQVAARRSREAATIESHRRTA
jgi:hypothetical protein